MNKSICWATARQLIIFSVLFFPWTVSAQRRMDFNQGWTFSAGDGAETIVNLPHDAMLGNGRSADVQGGGAVGYFKGGLFKYEKVLEMPSEWREKDVILHFGGAYMNSEVFVNGMKAGGYIYGYMPFDVKATGLLHEGKNTITVVTDNAGMLDSRWYSGAGLYRPVYLSVIPKTRIDDITVSTLSHSPAKIRVKVGHSKGKVRIEILDGDKVVARKKGDDKVIRIRKAKLWSAEEPHLYTVRAILKGADGTSDSCVQTFGIRTLEWSSKGFMVNGKSVLLKGGCLHSDNGILGAAEYEDAAIRKVRIMKGYGFNAIRSAHNPLSEEMLRACDQEGMYVMDELWDMWFRSKNDNDYGNYFKDNYMKDIAALVKKDYNHPSVIMYSIGNEVSEPMYEGGLEMAQSIVDELHRLDASRPTTAGINMIFVTPNGIQKLYQSYAEAYGLTGAGTGGSSPFAQNGANNPEASEKEEKGAVNTSLIFNEAAQADFGKVGDVVLQNEVDSATTPIYKILDIAGYNYASARYPVEAVQHPERVVVGSETYPVDIYDNWQMVEEYPYVIGDFMWTGVDYLGEVGIGAWEFDVSRRMSFTKPYPWKSADCGAIDLIGNPTGEAFHAATTWGDDKTGPFLSVRPVLKDAPVRKSTWRSTNSIPSWSWRGHEGTPMVVEVYSSAERIELYLDGKYLAEGTPSKNLVMFKFPYQEGTLEARAYVGDELVGNDRLSSATGRLALSLKAENEAKKGHLLFIDVDLVGENGQIDASSDAPVHVEVEGGTLLAFGSAQPCSEEDFLIGNYTTYYGRSLAVVKVGEDGADSIRIKATSDGLTPSTLTIPISR